MLAVLAAGVRCCRVPFAAEADVNRRSKAADHNQSHPQGGSCSFPLPCLGGPDGYASAPPVPGYVGGCPCVGISVRMCRAFTSLRRHRVGPLRVLGEGIAWATLSQRCLTMPVTPRAFQCASTRCPDILTAVALHLRHASSSFAFLALFSSQHAWCEKARGDLLSGKGILAYGPMERVEEEVHSEESVYQLHVVPCAFQAPFLCLCLLICGCALLLLLLSISGWLCARGCTPAGGESTNGRCQCNALRKTLIACVMAIHD